MKLEQIYIIIKNFLSNPWIVGIGGGILSGLVVAWVSQKMFSQREDKEYMQKISSANQEVIYSLRPLISESTFPSALILDSLISATSRKYKVDKKDMCSPAQFFDELIKEVMDSSFVPHDKKSEYCSHLIELRNQPSNTKDEIKFKLVESTLATKTYRDRYLSTLSLSMGMMVSITTILLTFSEFKSVNFNSNLFNLFLPISAALIVSLFGAVLMSARNKGNRLVSEQLLRRIRRFLP